MNEVTDPVETTEEPSEPEHVIVLEAECPSISGRSVLTFQAGHDPRDESKRLQLRILRNTGKGMFCKDWAAVEDIDAILAEAEDVTARTFQSLHAGRSINTGGFYLAVLKDLGVVEMKDDKSRQHKGVPGRTVLDALNERTGGAKPSASKKARKAGKDE